jgi:S1-C subfamily serine protease
MALLVLLASPAFAQSQRQDNPTVRESLRWMQTTLESGAGDYSVFHEVRSVRLEDFVGCKVHFSYSTHQEPYANGAPAAEPNKTYRVDYFFGLGDIDPTNITFSKGSGLLASDDGVYESPSFLTIRTRDDEKKIAIKLPWQSEADSRPEDTSLILSLDSVDQDYIARFAKAFKHAVEACGGKPSLFADSQGQGSDERAPLAAGGVAAQSRPPRKGTQDPWAAVSQAPVVAMRSAPPRKDIPTIAKAANGAIVSIIMSDKDGNPIAQGSGFLVSKDGIIVTNYHVIAEGSSALAKLPDGAFFVVDGVLAFDKARDVAVIKAHGENFRTLPLGNSDRVQVGQEVVAIGNPLSLESTVSNGIVSSIRTIEDQGGKYLQVTAPISPGSSGGPLFNMDGEVVGITTMYIKGGENLNFAIPINDAKPFLLQANSAKLQNFPNEPEPAAADAPPSAAGEGSAAPMNSPAYQSYQELLQSEDLTIYASLYACFDDNQKSNTFMVISPLFLADKERLNVTIEYFRNGVSQPNDLEVFEGPVEPFSSDTGVSATLHTSFDYKDNPGHQKDVFEWAPNVLAMKLGFGPREAPLTEEFNMQRSTGRYTDRVVFADGIPPDGFTTDKTGQCIRIPNLVRTPEEEYQSPR